MNVRFLNAQGLFERTKLKLEYWMISLYFSPIHRSINKEINVLKVLNRTISAKNVEMDSQNLKMKLFESQANMMVSHKHTHMYTYIYTYIQQKKSTKVISLEQSVQLFLPCLNLKWSTTEKCNKA